MAHPYLSSKNFADGGIAQWDSETDDSLYLNIRSYKWLALNGRPVPYRGAYVAELDFATKSTSTNAAYFSETGDLDATLVATGVAYAKFYMYAPSTPTWVMADTDIFAVLQLNAGATNEAGINIQYTTASGYRIMATGGTGTPACTLTFDKWICVEAYFLIDSGVGNDGVVSLYVDGTLVGSSTACDQGAITDYSYGCTGPDAGTTSGRLYLGAITFDDARLYPDYERFPSQLVLDQTMQVFVGPGYIDAATLLTTGASNDLKLFDTDLGSSAIDERGFLVNLNIAAHTSLEGPVGFRKGCYAVLSGTSPRALVSLTENSNIPAVTGPIYYSQGGMKRWAHIQ